MLRVARATRGFQTSARLFNSIFGAPKEGPYLNLPFKVKGKRIPFGIGYWGFLGAFFFFPFGSAYWHLKKSGSFAMA